MGRGGGRGTIEGTSSEMQSDFPEAAQPSDGRALFKSPHSPTSLASSLLENRFGVGCCRLHLTSSTPLLCASELLAWNTVPRQRPWGFCIIESTEVPEQLQDLLGTCSLLGVHASSPPHLRPSLCSKMLYLPEVAPRPSQGTDTVPGPVPGVGHRPLPNSSASPLAETVLCAPC